MAGNNGIVQAPALDIDARMLAKYGHDVSPSGRLERRIVANLFKHLDRKGFVCTLIYDGEEFSKGPFDTKGAMELIFNLDEVSVRFAPKAKPKQSPHGVLLVLGNGVDIVCDWNYYDDDRDGFNAAMEAFDSEKFA
jgi:hypothetical protein